MQKMYLKYRKTKRNQKPLYPSYSLITQKKLFQGDQKKIKNPFRSLFKGMGQEALSFLLQGDLEKKSKHLLVDKILDQLRARRRKQNHKPVCPKIFSSYHQAHNIQVGTLLLNCFIKHGYFTRYEILYKI